MLSKKRFAWISLTLAMVMLLVMSGCGSTSGDEGVKESTTVSTTSGAQNTTEEKGKALAKFEDLQNQKISILLEDDGTAKWSDPNTNTTKLFAEAGKLTLNITTVAGSDYASKLPTIVASGNIPDLMYVTSMPDFFKEYGPKGVFLPLDEYFPIMPNFQSRIAKYPEFYNLFKANDGKIYGFPLIMDNNAYFPTTLLIRQDILKENGINAREDIKTLDDLHNALKVLKEKKGNPPWVARLNKGKVEWDSRTAFMFGTGKGVYWSQKEEKFKFGPADANYKLMVETLSQWYAEGLIHPDIYSMEDQVFEQKFSNDEGYFALENYKATWSVNDNNEVFETILPPEINGQRYYGSQTNFHTPLNKYWAVSSKTKALDNILVAIDACYGKEISEQQNFGIQGDTYAVLPDGTRSGVAPGLKTPYATAEQDKAKADVWTARYNELGIMRARNIFVNEPENYETTYFGTDTVSKRARYYVENGVVADANPAVRFTQEEMDQVKMLETPINTYIEENLSKFITGIRPVSEFDKFLSDLNGMNYEALLKIYNDAYARYAEK